jgi:transcriptional regulator with PAS, ATPase and Fis domain
MEPSLQAKVLRFLEEKEFSPLGSNDVIKGDVRIIGATNKDLPGEVAKGHFREDLYYRLNVVTISLPPLRERKEDIPLLIQHFIKKYNEAMNKNVAGVDQKALEAS